MHGADGTARYRRDESTHSESFSFFFIFQVGKKGTVTVPIRVALSFLRSFFLMHIRKVCPSSFSDLIMIYLLPFTFCSVHGKIFTYHPDTVFPTMLSRGIRQYAITIHYPWVIRRG